MAAQLSGKRVLDVGCGFGRFLLNLESAGAQAYGVDVCEGYLQLSREFAAHASHKSPVVICGQGESLPFADASFDLVLCIRSLPYMDVATALREISRLLAEGGVLVHV